MDNAMINNGVRGQHHDCNDAEANHVSRDAGTCLQMIAVTTPITLDQDYTSLVHVDLQK